jgi:hypothetical protein
MIFRRSWQESVTEAMKKGGWGQKTPRTGYFGEENWDGGSLPYKPIYIFIYFNLPQW